MISFIERAFEEIKRSEKYSPISHSNNKLLIIMNNFIPITCEIINIEKHDIIFIKSFIKVPVHKINDINIINIANIASRIKSINSSEGKKLYKFLPIGVDYDRIKIAVKINIQMLDDNVTIIDWIEAIKYASEYILQEIIYK